MLFFFGYCNPSYSNNQSKDHISRQKEKDFKSLPIDQSSKDPTLVEFIKRLKVIIIQKDTSALYNQFDSAIAVSFGGGLYGKEAFKERWNLVNPAKSELWNSLLQILKLGGVFEKAENNKELFNIPYANSNTTYEKLDPDYDCFNTAVCINSHEPVFQTKSFNAKTISYLQYDFVILLDNPDQNSQLVKIQTFNKKSKGFINKNSLIYCADPKLCLQKNRAGQWKIISYAPYD